jgi:hypothetical protein
MVPIIREAEKLHEIEPAQLFLYILNLLTWNKEKTAKRMKTFACVIHLQEGSKLRF